MQGSGVRGDTRVGAAAWGTDHGGGGRTRCVRHCCPHAGPAASMCNFTGHGAARAVVQSPRSSRRARSQQRATRKKQQSSQHPVHALPSYTNRPRPTTREQASIGTSSARSDAARALRMATQNAVMLVDNRAHGVQAPVLQCIHTPLRKNKRAAGIARAPSLCARFFGFLALAPPRARRARQHVQVAARTVPWPAV